MSNKSPLTTDPVAAPGHQDNNLKPEFVRLPPPGVRCPITGLSRSKLNELVLPCPANGNNPPVRSISLRPKGSARGARLIVLASLLTYLHGLEAEQNLAA